MKYKYQEFKTKTKLILIICQLWKLLAKIAVGGKKLVFLSSSASPLQSICSWWDQSLLGTLVVVALQFPCEKKMGVKGKGGSGEKRKGWIKTPSKGQGDLSESSRPADYRRTRVDAQRQAERETEAVRWWGKKTRETFYSLTKRD